MNRYWCVRIIVSKRKTIEAAFNSLGSKGDFKLPKITGIDENEITYDGLHRPTANLAFWLEMFHPHIKVQRNDEESICFDILCPRHIRPQESNTWANLKADRIASFGLNAVAAPETL